MSFVYDLYVDNNLNVDGNAVINGDLHVSGTTTTVDSINLNIKDNHIYLNNGYTGVVGETGGIVLNSNGISSANITDTTSQFTATSAITTAGSATFTAGQKVEVTGTVSNNGVYTVVSHIGTALVVAETSLVTETVVGTINLISDVVDASGFTSATTVVTLGTASFTANDIIQISSIINPFTGEIGNLGLFHVASHVGTTLTIDATTDFAQTTFVAETSFPEITDVTNLIITKINLTILQADSSGTWKTTNGATSTDLTANIKDILLAGGSSSNNSLTLLDNNNQLIFDHSEAGGEVNTAIINVLGPSETTATYTINDLGAGVSVANFVMSEGAQTLNGDYTIGSAAGSLIFQDSDQSHNYTIGVGNITADSTYALPSLDGAHTFVVSNDSSGQVLLADGAVGTPAYAFTSDPNTGMYTDGSDSLNFAYNGASILEVTADGVIINGSITSTGAVVESVKAWAGVGSHAMTITGTGSERVQYVTHTTAASITLPSVTSADDGIKFTIINLLDADNNLVINRSDADTLDNEALTSLTLKKRNQRITLQYIDAVTNWYIV